MRFMKEKVGEIVAKNGYNLLELVGKYIEGGFLDGDSQVISRLNPATVHFTSNAHKVLSSIGSIYDHKTL